MDNYIDAGNLEVEEEEDARKQYIAVQQGLDIPLKGLRKPAPQASNYNGKLNSNHFISLLLAQNFPCDRMYLLPSSVFIYVE